MNGSGPSSSSHQGSTTGTINNPKPVIKNKAPHANVAHRCLSHAPSSQFSDSKKGGEDDGKIQQQQQQSRKQRQYYDEHCKISSSNNNFKNNISSNRNGSVTVGLPIDSTPPASSIDVTTGARNGGEKAPLLTSQTTKKEGKSNDASPNKTWEYPLKPYKPSRDPGLGPLDDCEVSCRQKAESRGPVLFVSNSTSALIVFFACICSYESLLSVALSVGFTCYVYFVTLPEGITWSMSWTLLGFAVVTPMSISIGLAFQRRELALRQIAIFRSSCFQIYLAHTTWDWGSKEISGRELTSDKVNWQQHSDEALSELIGMADELCRFLTLPNFSRARHRVTPWGRHEASRTVEVAYRLWDTLLTTRMSKLTYLVEIMKKHGMPGNETARIRQWERFVAEAIEQLRILKTYRTPQALRSFARLFTIILPGFYSPDFAQLAQESNSIGLGITFAVLTSFALSALFESIYMLEDPFVAHLSLDGIDVHEELRVLHWHQLINTRQIFFPNALPYVDKFSNDFVMSPKVRKNNKNGQQKSKATKTDSKSNQKNQNNNNDNDNGSIEHDGDINNNHDIKISMINADVATTTEHDKAGEPGGVQLIVDDDAYASTNNNNKNHSQRPSSSTSNNSIARNLMLDRDEPNPTENSPSMTRESSYAHFRQASLTTTINYKNGEK